MIDSIAAGASNSAQSNNPLKETSERSSKVKLDLESIPENKVKIDGPASAGKGKGLVLDLQA